MPQQGQAPAQFEAGGTTAVREETEVSDLDEAVWENVKQEAPNKTRPLLWSSAFVCCHRLNLSNGKSPRRC
jgi:hypothetical protein